MSSLLTPLSNNFEKSPVSFNTKVGVCRVYIKAKVIHKEYIFFKLTKTISICNRFIFSDSVNMICPKFNVEGDANIINNSKQKLRCKPKKLDLLESKLVSNIILFSLWN